MATLRAAELVDVAGARLHAYRRPGASPTVVLCSALGLVCSDWDAVLASLEGADVVVFDRPGIGHSPLPSPGWPDAPPATLAEEVARVAAVGPAVGAAPPYVVVGHSSGGLYAQAFARLHPADTAGVVLLDASGAAPPPSTAGARIRHTVRASLARTPLPGWFGPGGRRAAVWAQTVGGDDPLDRQERRRVYGTPHGARGVLAELDAFDAAAAALQALERTHPLPPVPVRVVTAASTGRPWPRRDGAWVREQAQLARALDAEHRVIDDAAHLLTHDRPEAVAREIGQVLRAVQDGASWLQGR